MGPLIKTLLHAVLLTMAALPHCLSAADPYLRFRANQNSLTTDPGGSLVWTSGSSGIDAIAEAGKPQPAFVPNAVNQRGALSFAGNSCFSVNTTACFKGSYTMYVVLRYGDVVGANTIIGGNEHALWLANTAYPHVLHANAFSNQAVSTVPLDGWCVLRVTFDASSGRCRIAVNNREGASTKITATSDPAFFIGALAGANNFVGDIAEVVYYHGVLSDADRTVEDNLLHTYYGIPRMPDPKPVVVFSVAPKRLQLIPIGDSIRVDGIVVDPTVLTVELKLDSNGVVIAERDWTVATDGTSFSFKHGIPFGHVQQYRVVVTASRSGTRDTVLDADSIAYGIVFAMSGQSNSIVGDTSLARHPLARTFGVNYSQDPADTAWSLSDPTLYGGGSSVGAIGMHLQTHLAGRNMPSALINGGVSATAIQHHFPYAENVEELATVHGSWAYRRRVANVNKFINWMFWYQGESNSGSEDYIAMFDSVYKQWHLEMPNLKHIIVIQIRPGCGSVHHARLREQQRQLQKKYPDVMVIAASGIPHHNNCHFFVQGYQTLGSILAQQMNAGDLDGSRSLSPEWSSPDIDRAFYLDDSKKNVRLHFKGYQNYTPTLQMASEVRVKDTVRTHQQAFFGNANENMIPQRVQVQGDAVDLSFLSPVASVSYVPTRYYAGTDVIFQGPWLVNANGVGALTFYDFPVVETLDVARSISQSFSNPNRAVSIGERVIIMQTTETSLSRTQDVTITDMRGEDVCTLPLQNASFLVPALAAAPYLVRSGGERFFIVVLK